MATVTAFASTTATVAGVVVILKKIIEDATTFCVLQAVSLVFFLNLTGQPTHQ